MGRPWSVYLSGNNNMLFSLIGLFIVDASLFSLTLLFGSILGSPATLATSTSAVSGASVTVQVACTLNGTGMNTHNAEIPNGTYRADIGTTTLKTFCNDGEGFAIYVAGYTGDDTLVYSTGPYLYNAYPSDTGGRDDAFSIRCLLR